MKSVHYHGLTNLGYIESSVSILVRQATELVS